MGRRHVDEDTERFHIGCGLGLLMTAGWICVPLAIWWQGRDALTFVGIYAACLIAAIWIGQGYESDY